MEKRADLYQMLRAIADPAVREWAGKRGLVLGDPMGRRNIMHVLNDASYEKDLTEALYGAAQKDRPSWEKLMRGMAVMSGSDWTPGHAAHAANLSGDIAKVSPYIMRWAPDVWDKLHGSTGSVASLTHAIAEQNRHTPGFDAANAHRTASGVFDELYGGSDPMKHRGFSAAEMGKVYGAAAKRGLIDTDGKPADVARSLSTVAGPISAVRDSLGEQGMSGIPMENMFEVYDRVASKLQGTNTDIEGHIRRGEYLRRMGVPSEFALAHQQRGDVGAGSGTNLPELTAMDEQLRQQAAVSPAGNIAAATARMQDTMGMPTGSPAERLMEQIQGGKLPQLSSSQWIRLMEQSGIDASTAASMISDQTSNQRYMTPDLMNTVRQSQFSLDMSKYVPKLPTGATKAQQVQHQSALEHLANSRGYANWHQLQQLHGPALGQAGNTMQQVSQQAQQAKQLSPYGRGGPVSRTLDVVRNATPKTGVKDLVTRGLLNTVPTSTLPKTSVGKGMAKGLS